jgi:hypothetical protein
MDFLRSASSDKSHLRAANFSTAGSGAIASDPQSRGNKWNHQIRSGTYYRAKTRSAKLQ